MTKKQKEAVISSAKEFFRLTIIPKHIKNLEDITLKSFDYNPFLINYLAAFLCGDTSAESLAKALLYPRVLGTSINTSFGQNTQVFISQLSQIIGNPSGIEGIDIEFIDAIDKRRKYCQVKAGPNTINKDDAATIQGHFKKLMGKARLDRLAIQVDDMIVGILYGEKISSNYKIIASTFPVYCGKEFWLHLTGDNEFYYRLSKAFGEVVEDENIDGKFIIEKKVQELAKEIKLHGGI